ncbi:MAG: amidohydrolase [Acidimicrobiales bacterium]
MGTLANLGVGSDRPVLLRNAVIVPVEGEPIQGGSIAFADGIITAVGDSSLAVPDGAEVLDLGGRWVVPSLIDAHTHVGLHQEAGGWAGNDTNEMTEPVTAQVRALDAINPDDQGFRDAIEGGVLVVNVNPGSGNPIGGQTVALRCFGRVVDEMVLREPSGMKSALGENPKRVYGERKQMPSTRLGTASVIREALTKAQNYENAKERALQGEGDAKAPDRDLKLEALGKVLRCEIPWRQHSHRADDIMTAVRIAEEFGYDLVIDHGTEAHLVADRLAARAIPVIIGPLFTSRSKAELINRSLRNPGKLAKAGVTIAITTDHPVVPLHFLVHQATLAVKEGLDRTTALEAITINPARIVGIDHLVGSLAVGKDAELCVWSGDPLDVMSRVELAFSRGRCVYRFDNELGHGEFAETA